jgi:hypothetical protein
MQFKEFDAASMAATRHAWMGDADNGSGFPPEIEQQLDWAQGHMTLTGTEVAYGIFKDGGHVALAICELVITRRSARSKWIKFMRLRLRPSVDVQLFNNDPAGFRTAIEAYIACVQGVFHVKNQEKANTIKVYGRTQQQMGFLTILATSLQNRPELTFKTSIEGRWLVLTWKTQ